MTNWRMVNAKGKPKLSIANERDGMKKDAAARWLRQNDRVKVKLPGRSKWSKASNVLQSSGRIK